MAAAETDASAARMNARGVTFEAQRKANEKADVSEHTTAQGVVVKITGVS